MDKKDHVAKLTIYEFPRTKESQVRMVEWLRLKIKEIKKTDPDQYARTVNMRLMK